MVSGRKRDSQFAKGFLSVLEVSGLKAVTSGHQIFRPVVTLESPMGRIEGDAAFVICDDGTLKRTLVVVEREGSGPGNERNLLKWYAASRQGKEIFLRGNGVEFKIEWSRLLVLLAFGRSVAWDRSDYTKTVAFCREFADLLNQVVATENPSIQFRIQSSQGPVDDWVSEGGEHAAQLISSLVD